MKKIFIAVDNEVGNNVKKYIHKECLNLGLEENRDYSFQEFSGKIFEADFLAEKSSKELNLFPSTHKSKDDKPNFTVHPTGVIGQKMFGGKDNTLNYSSGYFLRRAFEILEEENNTNIGTTLEATHHGPSDFHGPVLFVEIGATKKEWEDQENLKIIARTISRLIGVKEEAHESALAFGGGHYCEKFLPLLKDKINFCHFIPGFKIKEALEILPEIISKCTVKPTKAFIDWENCSKKQELIEKLKNAGIESIRC
ncbi:D-aminoacyl-tRNA deacylase [uncultured archaeon]|nr:D-aminoacyl-tRNA deacylase [uncultured archaeon]